MYVRTCMWTCVCRDVSVYVFASVSEFAYACMSVRLTAVLCLCVYVSVSEGV